MIEMFWEILAQGWALLKNMNELVAAVGMFGVFAIVFAETGLLLGFFLPGDSLLLATGAFSHQAGWNIWTLGLALTVAAISGDAVGYAIGKKAGKALYQREDSLLFRKKHLLAAQNFYDRHGGKTIILARFMPIVRTFAPTVAGAADMHYPRFALFNIMGGAAWIWSFLLGGYFLVQAIPNIDQNLHFVVLAVVAVSLMPVVVGYLKERRNALE